MLRNGLAIILIDCMFVEEKNIQCRAIFLAKLLKKDDEKFEKEEKLCPALKKRPQIPKS